MSKNFFYYLLTAIIFALIGWFANTAYHLPKPSENIITQVRPTPLTKYSIEDLSKADIQPSVIEIGKVLKTEEDFTSYEFTMKFSPDMSNDLKITSGLINIPNKNGEFPVIVMFRGYVDPTQYFTGNGTQHAGEYFASNGFITVAPDFLGYGESSKETENVFESRFQTYVTAITTLKSISSISKFDRKNIFIWGHSNGGQISLTTLEATSFTYPTVLWAPVSKPFPYSILYYTDDASDSGKFLRSKLSEFENDYDTDLYSLTNYLDRINAPIQLNQGTNDSAVPYTWSDKLAEDLTNLKKDITYIKYRGADHNMSPNWNQAITNALDFYKKHIQ